MSGALISPADAHVPARDPIVETAPRIAPRYPGEATGKHDAGIVDSLMRVAIGRRL